MKLSDVLTLLSRNPDGSFNPDAAAAFAAASIDQIALILRDPKELQAAAQHSDPRVRHLRWAVTNRVPDWYADKVWASRRPPG